MFGTSTITARAKTARKSFKLKFDTMDPIRCRFAGRKESRMKIEISAKSVSNVLQE